jgi:glycosyltransferase involved in cell wall biosynthesis
LKRALIPVHWLTDFGGLHENVLDTAAGLIAGGWQVTVMAPPSKFGSRLVAAGARLIEDSLEDVPTGLSLALADASAHGKFDIVHAHPFQARRVGMAVAKALGIPLLVTIHGQYDDEFDQYGSSVQCVVCVCTRIAEFVARLQPALKARLAVAPNGVDFSVFAPAEAVRPMPGPERPTTIAIASRLDPDKGVLSQVVRDLVEYLAATGKPGQFELCVAGDRLYGPPDNPFTAAIDRAAASGVVMVRRAGWIDDRAALQRFLAGADIAVAPGRAAMEAIACGVPTIAAASRGYIGLVTTDNLELARDTNFGGVQETATAYAADAVVADFSNALRVPRAATAALRDNLRRSHELRLVQATHLRIYDGLLASRGDASPAAGESR